MKHTCKIPYVFALLVLSTGLMFGCSSHSGEKKEVHYQRGISHMETGEYPAAIIEFRNAVQIDPRFAEARYQLGLAYIHTQQPGRALGELERAASLDPTNTDALIKVAEMYAMGNKPAESREAVERILAVDSDFPDAYALLAQLEMTAENPAAAKRAIEKALSITPGESRYNMILARILADTGNREEAETVLKKAVNADPSTRNLKILINFYAGPGEIQHGEDVILPLLDKHPAPHELYVDMSNFYAGKGRLDQAETYLLKAVDNDPESSALRIGLGNFYLAINQTDMAEKAFQAAVENAEDPSDEKAILADFYFNTNRHAQAEELSQAVLERSPGHPMARLVRAKLLVRKQENSEALVILDELVRDFPRWGEAYYQKGVAHLNRGETRLSYNAADRAMQYMPNHPDAETLMAQHLLLQQDFNAARDTAVSALRKNPGNLRAGLILAKAMLRSGETEAAVRLFERMADHAPDNIEVLSGKSEAYLADDRKDDAMATFEKMLTLQPDFVPAMAAVNALLLEKGKPGEAIAATRRQIEISPGNPYFLMMLAELVNAVDAASEEALALLENAREIAPDIPRIYEMMARMQIQRGETEKAIDNYSAMVKVNPDSVNGHMALGTLLERSGDIDGAMKAYRRALRVQPDFAPAANNLAWLIANSENPDLGEALRLALVAMEARPDDPYITDTLGYIHYKRGSHQLALTQFARSTAKRPDVPVLRYHYALGLYADGQLDRARQQLEKALELDTAFPEREEAKKLLARIEANEKSGNQ